MRIAPRIALKIQPGADSAGLLYRLFTYHKPFLFYLLRGADQRGKKERRGAAKRGVDNCRRAIA